MEDKNDYSIVKSGDQLYIQTIKSAAGYLGFRLNRMNGAVVEKNSDHLLITVRGEDPLYMTPDGNYFASSLNDLQQLTGREL